MKKQFYLTARFMNILQQFLRKGTENTTDQFDARRILLLNLFFGVSVLTILAALTQSLLTEEPLVMSLALSVACVLMIGIPILGRRNPNVGAIYMMLLANALVWFFANSQGLAAGTYFFYFPLFFANGWLMDFRKPLNAVLSLGITLCGVVLVLLIPDSVFGFEISIEIQQASFAFNLVCAAFIMALNTGVIVWMNHRRQQELETRVEEREKATSQLSSALKEKEVLLAEIHHRVKNNLAIIRGLLNMQMHTTENQIAKDALLESVNRVSTMALIHQKLYTSTHPDSIDLAPYVNELVREISASYKTSGTDMPVVNTNVRDISLTLNRAVPCGLILNELLSNAFKHAFNVKTQGIIDIALTHDPINKGCVNLIVSDNGSGIPEGFDPTTTTTLGISIVQSLADQLDGHFSFNSTRSGTEMRVNFPVENV